MEVAGNGEQDIKKMKKYIKSLALQYGADVCGIGSIERFADAPAGFSPIDIYSECKSVIAVGIALPKGLYEINPRLIYGHFNADICGTVDQLTLKLAKAMEREYECIAGCRKCIESCPVHAIGDGCVEQKACRMNTYGKTARGFDTVNCNRCRTVCPMRYGKCPICGSELTLLHKKAKKSNCDWQCKRCNKVYKTIHLLDELNEKGC